MPETVSTAGVRASTLVDRLSDHARLHPRRRAFSFVRDGDGSGAHETSFGDLDERARRVAAVLGERAAREERPRALLLVPQSIAFVEALFGCFYAGICAVPTHAPSAVGPRRSLARLRSIAADATPRFVLTTRALLGVRDAVPELARAEWIALEDTDGVAPCPASQRPRADDLAILQYSSGSTGDPRGVMVAHANLMHNEALICEAFEHSPGSVVLGWLPFFHDMGLIGNVLQPIYAGAECVLMSPMAFLKNPLSWLRAIAAHRATTSGAPNFAYEMCAARARERGCDKLDLSSWSLAFVGAEPVRAGTLERFAEVFAPHGFRREALYPCYGLAEATLMVTGGSRATAPRVATFERPPGVQKRVSCGPARHGLAVAIVDPASGRRAPGGEGEIWVRGPSVARGYFGKPEATRATFGARLDGEDGEWLRTGDLGRLVDEELYVTGRLKDVVVVKGAKHAAEDVEHTVERVDDPSLRRGACAVFAVDDGERERLVVVHEVERGAIAEWRELAERMSAAVVEEHGVAADVVALVRAGSIPRTTSGKVRRGACRELFSRGALDEVHRFTLRAAS